MTPYVPVEIIEQIIQNVSFPSLTACALVCCGFRVPSQRLIFRDVVLRSAANVSNCGNTDLATYSSFQSALASTPELALYVREFSLDEVGTQAVLISQPTLPSILILLRKVTRFIMSCHYPGYDYDKFSPSLKKALAAVFRSPSINNISLHGIINLSPETMKRIQSISTIELANIEFAEQDQSNQPSADAGCSCINTLILGSQDLRTSEPLLDSMSSWRTRLKKLVIRDLSSFRDVKVVREIIKMQRNSLTVLDLSTILLGIAADLELLDISDIPHLRTVKVSVEFGHAPLIRLDDVMNILSKVRKENNIQQITIDFMFYSLENLRSALEDLETLDTLLSGSLFPCLQRVEIIPSMRRPVRHKRNSVTGGMENFKIIVESLLPSLKDNGQLYFENIALI
ncbi:hypothetical protein BDQ17DRAFT_1547844 [Cyathus striatus]|nr:hypothetical protein BDQ17DRAFT_1547844 [Cyathus striatus]